MLVGDGIDRFLLFVGGILFQSVLSVLGLVFFFDIGFGLFLFLLLVFIVVSLAFHIGFDNGDFGFRIPRLFGLLFNLVVWFGGLYFLIFSLL